MPASRRLGKPGAGPSRLRSFDPARIAGLEYRAWLAYYRRDWLRLLAASIALVHAGFGMNWLRTLHGAWLVLRANQLWAPVPVNDPDGARRCMRRFYGLVRLSYGEPRDVAEAARLEVDWWRAHRERQRPQPDTMERIAGTGRIPTRDDAGIIQTALSPAPAGQPGAELVDALTRLYAFLYREPESGIRPAAIYRAQAMDISDQWNAEGGHADSPLLPLEHAALVRSYAALLAVIHHL
jgi:hypothetical protein